MHASFTLAAVALLSTLAAAQIPGLPSCAATCVGTSFGDCGSLDVKCICSTENLISNLSCCVSTACNEDDQKKTIEFANSLCSGQGVTNLPTAATCEGSASSTAAPSSSMSMMSSSSMMDMSSSMSSMMDSASMSASSAMSSASGMASSMSSSMMSGASASSTSAASGSASATSSGSTEQSTGGADSLRSGVVGVVGLVLAGVAAAL